MPTCIGSTASTDRYRRAARGRSSSTAAAAAFAAMLVLLILELRVSSAASMAVFVRPSSGSSSSWGVAATRARSGDDWGASGGNETACGGSEEEACPDLRSALSAIPESMPAGTWPELRLLPGLYTGNENVFLGGRGDAEYPSTARNVSIVGWGKPRDAGSTVPYTSSERARAATADHGVADAAGAPTNAVLSCQGRHSQDDAHAATRGLWLMEGRITSLANLTVTDCPAGGVGVDAWEGNDPFSSPTLSSVTLSGNGGDDCQRGGGLLVTSTSPTVATPVTPTEGAAEEIAADGYGVPQGAARGVESRDGQTAGPVLTLFGCVVRNNSALLGGGIAVSSDSSSSFSGMSASAMSPVGVTFPTGTVENSPIFSLRETDEAAADWEGGDEQRKASALDVETGTPTSIIGFQRSGSTRTRAIDQARESLTSFGAAAGTRNTGGAATLLSLAIDGGAVIEANRAASGGGIWASDAVVTAMDGGGGVSIRGNIAEGLRGGCVEERNCAGRGGGICADGGSLFLQGSSFDGNRAEAHQARDEYAKGGGLAARGSLVEATDCSFTGNSATAMAKSSAGIGGGAYLDSSNTTLRACRFEENTAEGIDLFGQMASFGGGLASRGPAHVTNISGSSFVANAAGKGGSGGGLWVEDGARAVFASTEVVNNTAASSYTHKGAGGGIAVSASALLAMSGGCRLEGNVAGPENVGASDPECLSGQGGGIHASGSGITLAGVTLIRNRCETGALDTGCAGGAISLTGRGPSAAAAANVAGSDDDGGGAVFEDCLFEANEASGAATNNIYSGAGQGGAAAIRFAFPTFTRCEFTENAAEGGGGAAPATGGAVLLFLSRGDAAAGDGDGTPAFVNCTFAGNRAGSGGALVPSRVRGHGIGGALAAIASAPRLTGCSFTNNTAVALFPTSSGVADDGVGGGGDGGGDGGGTPITGGSPSFGGAIMLTSDCSGTRLDACTLDGNVAVNGVGGDLAVLAAPSSDGRHSSSYLASIAGLDLHAAFASEISAAGEASATAASTSVAAAAAAVAATSMVTAAAPSNTAPASSSSPASSASTKTTSTTPTSKILPDFGTASSNRRASLPAHLPHPAALPPPPRVQSASPGPFTAAAAATATVVLSSCSFRPAAPQGNPAVPWADGSSETTVSPFLFVLDGGTVELAAPVFESAGQAFIARVNPPAPSGVENESDITHLRIVGSGGGGGGGGGGYGSDSQAARRSDKARLSVVSVGGRVSLINLDGDDGGGSAVRGEGGSGAKTAERTEVGPTAAPFAVEELVVLRGQLLLQGGGGDGERQEHPGVTVEESARFRMASISVVAGAAGAGGDGDAGDAGDTGDTGDAGDAGAAEVADTWCGGGVGGCGLGDGEDSRNVSGAGVELEAAGGATLGEAWEPKPFFVGTSLSQLFPPVAPAPSQRRETRTAGTMDDGGDRHATQAGGGGGIGPEDLVVFDGVVMELKGESVVRGDVSLLGAAIVQVAPSGSLTLTGDAAIRRTHELPSPPAAPLVSSSPTPPAVRNTGVLVFPRGFSLTVAGGIEQGPAGESVMALPPPLYAPSPNPAAAGCSSRELQPSGKPSEILFDGNRPSEESSTGVSVDGDGHGEVEGAGKSCEGRGAGGGDSRWRQYPLVVESGSTTFAGAFNASVARGGGESERVKMSRKWPIARFASQEAADGLDTGELSMRGPPGVTMMLSMQPAANDTSTAARQQQGQKRDQRKQQEREATRDQPGLFSEGGGRSSLKSEGLELETQREYDGDANEDSKQWELVVEAAFIECQSMLAYANVSTAGGPCQACLLNMECSWCGGEGSGSASCVPTADRPIKAGGRRGDANTCQTGSCCPLGCNGVGKCDFFSATCSCPWLYAGTSCAELSTGGAVALSMTLSALAVVMLILACGRSSRRKQMEAVVGTLQELKRGLLSDTDGGVGDDDISVASFGGNSGSSWSSSRMALSIGGRGRLPAGRGSGGGGIAGGGGGSGGGGGGSGLSYQHMWPRDYIQDLQQNLALRDVMVSFSELELADKIGSGAAGTVWRGSWRGAAVAVKVIRRPFHQAVELTGRDLEVFKREAYLMTRLRHPNIVLIMGVTFAPPGHRITLDGPGAVSIRRRMELGFETGSTTSQGSLCIVTELLSRGSLDDVIRKGGLRTASYGLILDIALQAARGMLYLHTHSPPVIHRDLKSSNLVVDEHWHVKVTDFGMSRFVPETSPNVAPTSSSLPSADANDLLSPPAVNGVDEGGGVVDGDATTPTPGYAHPLATPPRPRRDGGLVGGGDGGGEDGSRGDYDDSLEEKSERPPRFSASVEITSGGGGGGREKTAVAGREGAAATGGGTGGGGRVGEALRGVVRWGRGSGTSSVVGREDRGSAGGGGSRDEVGLTTNLGTVAWAAPEMLLGGEGGRGEYTAKVDVYSFGVVLWELWERRRPFEDLRSRFDIADTVAAGGRPPIGRGCPPPYADLIQRCWHQNPRKRPPFQDIVEDLEAEIEAAESGTEL